MAGSITSQPVSPASCYRPLQFVVQRDDPAKNAIDEIFIADGGDVSTIGNGLVVGDVVLVYSSAVIGDVPAVAGQQIILDASAGPYKGVHRITNAFDYSGDHYAVLDAEDLGDFTPGANHAMRVWLENYTVWCKVQVYTDPEGDPQEVILRGMPDEAGVTTFHVDTVIKDYFSHRIDPFVLPDLGSALIQTAHGVTSLLYRVMFGESYEEPENTGEIDPFDEDHLIYEDDTEDNETFRKAVNAAHPYTEWAEASMDAWVVGSTSSKFLTNAPRGASGIQLTLGEQDRFCVHMLTEANNEAAFTLRFYDITSGSESLIGSASVVLDDLHSAFSLLVGPKDIEGEVTVPDKYRVKLISVGLAVIAESIDVTVDRKCKEGHRKVGFLNPLGGVDLYTFRGRENRFTEAERATVRKPYGPGTGFDWQERSYRNDPNERVIVSTAPLPKEVREWLARDIARSSNVVTIEGAMVAPVTLLSKSLQQFSSGPFHKPITIEYRLGVEQVAQRS